MTIIIAKFEHHLKMFAARINDFRYALMITDEHDIRRNQPEC